MSTSLNHSVDFDAEPWPCTHTDRTGTYLTPREAALVGRMALSELRRAYRSGDLPFIQFVENGRVLIRRVDLVAYLDAHLQNSGAK